MGGGGWDQLSVLARFSLTSAMSSDFSMHREESSLFSRISIKSSLTLISSGGAFRKMFEGDLGYYSNWSGKNAKSSNLFKGLQS